MVTSATVAAVPVLEVTALPQHPDVDTARVSAAVCEAVAGLLGEEPRGTWVVWTTLPAGAYAEHDDAPPLQPRGTHPPLVRVTAAPEDVPGAVDFRWRSGGRCSHASVSSTSWVW